MLLRGSALMLKFGLSFYLARYLDLRTLGLYGLVVGATLVLPMLFRAGLTSTITRILVNAEPAHMVDAIQHYVVWISICYASALVLLAVSQAAGWSLHQPVNLYLVWMVVVAEHLAADLSLLFSNLYKAEVANSLGLVQTVIWVLPFVTLSYLTPSLRTLDVLLAMWAAGTACAVFLFAWLLRAWPWRARPALRVHWYADHMRASFYLYLSDLTGTVAQFSDRYVIAALIDMEHAGVYTLFFQLSNAVYTLVSTSVINVHRPPLLSAYQRGQVLTATALLKAMQWRAFGTMLLLALVVGLLFQWLAPMLRRPLVLQYLPLLWLTFAATAIKIACLTAFVELFAKGLDRQLFGLNVLILVLVSAGCVALIRVSGIYGIPLAIGLAYLLTWYGIGRTVRTHTRSVTV